MHIFGGGVRKLIQPYVLLAQGNWATFNVKTWNYFAHADNEAQ